MPELLKNFFVSEPFIHHEHCYLWEPELVWLHLISDTLIALAYYFIPLILLYFVQKRKDLPFNWIFLLFAAFIFACGTTHIIEVWTFWHPNYWLLGLLKVITATVSLYTAGMLVALVPKALALPSPAQFEAANRELHTQITYHVRALESLRESEKRFRTLVTSMDDIVFMLDCEQRHVAVCGQWIEKYKLTLELVIGKTWREIFGSEAALIHEEAGERALAGETALYEWSLKSRNGTQYFQTSLSPLRDAQCGIVGIVGVGRDITERRAMERMKDEFVSVVSHELRTPLTSIHGALGLLASGLLGTLSEQGKRMLEIAVQNTDRLDRLINDILDLERLDSGNIPLAKQTCNAADLMVKAAEVMQVIAENAGITLSVSPQSVQLLADPDGIIQLLTNLLSNAIKFSPQGTTVLLTVECLGNEILFQVKDQGQGIPADKLESIFERFQQVDVSYSRRKGGTGLGLAICRTIVQEHGGQIWAESTLGEGSTFYFTLPILVI